MTERPDPDRVPEPVPTFEDPGVEHPPVEEPTQVQEAGTAGGTAGSAWDRRVSGEPAPVAESVPEPFAPPSGPPTSSPGPNGGSPVEDRPELPVLGAFAGGVVLALILKRLGN